MVSIKPYARCAFLTQASSYITQACIPQGLFADISSLIGIFQMRTVTINDLSSVGSPVQQRGGTDQELQFRSCPTEIHPRS